MARPRRPASRPRTTTISPKRRVRPRVRRDAGDLLGAQARAACARAGGASGSGSPPGAVDLRRPLADPLPAVRALGHVRAHLGAAVLADDEQVRLRHGAPSEYPARGAGPAVTRRWPRPPRAPWRRGSRARPRGGRGWPRRPRSWRDAPLPLSRMSSRQSKSASEPSSSACGRRRSITRRVSSGTGTRSCFGRSTSCAVEPVAGGQPLVLVEHLVRVAGQLLPALVVLGTAPSPSPGRAPRARACAPPASASPSRGPRPCRSWGAGARRTRGRCSRRSPSYSTMNSIRRAQSSKSS